MCVLVRALDINLNVASLFHIDPIAGQEQQQVKMCNNTHAFLSFFSLLLKTRLFLLSNSIQK